MNFSIEWIPGAAVVMVVVLLSAPLLGWLIALIAIAALLAAVLAGLAGAIAAVPYLLVRLIRRREPEPAEADHGQALTPTHRPNLGGIR